jgi:hypothetical protein
VKVLNVFGLTLALVGMCTAANADTRTYTETTQTVNPPHVLQSWMEPTAYKESTEINASGEASLRREPIIWERHERVEVPIVNEEHQTVIRSSPETRVVSSRTVTSSSFKRIAHRRPQHLVAVRKHVNRSLAYNTTTYRSAVTTEQTDRTTVNPVVIERRDPALDLY